MKKSQLIKIIKEEISYVLEKESFATKFARAFMGMKPVPVLSTLAKIGNLQAQFSDAYQETKYDTSRGNVSHYFKKGTPSEVLDQAKQSIERAARRETKFKEYLKSKDMSVNVKVYTANDLVRVSPAPAKQEITPPQDKQKLMSPVAR